VFLLQVRQYVVRREVPSKKEGKPALSKAPRIQRLVTPQRLQHKRHLKALKRRRAESAKDAAVSFPDSFFCRTRFLILVPERIRQASPPTCKPREGEACRGEEEKSIIDEEIDVFVCIMIEK
jgi:hypothetical protein